MYGVKLSTKGRYAARALLDVALNQDGGPMPLRAIAGRQGISLNYLGHIAAPLVAAGILRSTRGARGGVSLGRPPAEIKLSEVVEIFEGSLAPVECVDDAESCPRAEACVTRDVWAQMRRAMADVLESTTLQDLAERHRERCKAEEVIYYI